MLRFAVPLIATFGYSAASTMGLVPNMWGPVLGEIQRFKYDKADDTARQSFLWAQSSLVRTTSNRDFAGTRFGVTDFKIDTDRKRVTFLFRYPRGMVIDKASMRRDTPLVLSRTCKTWSTSLMAEAGVSWRFSYRNVQNQEVGSVLLNPGTCMGYV